MGPITRISVISTGSVQIRPEHVRGTRAPMAWWLLTSRRWTAARPINVYVIEHRDGLVLFDTGQDRRSVTDRGYFPRGPLGYLYARLARFAISPQDTLTARLATLGYGPADVVTAVLSHLHQDHIGGLAELSGAEIVVSSTDWKAVDRPLAAFDGVLARHLRLPGLQWRPVEPVPVADPSVAPFTSAYDLRGDGSMLLLPTPGHTPGSMSMLVRQEGLATVLLVGDLTYDAALLAREQVPGVGNRAGLLASTRAVRALASRYPDLVVLAAHDPAARGLLEGALARSATS